MKKLPKTLYARMEFDPNAEAEYPICYDKPEDAIEDDGPTTIGTYQLVATQTLRKIIEATSDKKARK